MVVACCYACAKWVQCWNLTSLFQLEWGFFKDISYASWVLVNMMMESSCCFQKCSRNSGHRCLYNGLPQNLGRLLFSMPTVDSWWSQWGVIAARHCYSQLWWGWWSHTLWVTVIRLWQHCVLSELVVVLLELTEWFCLQKCCCLLWILIDMLNFLLWWQEAPVTSIFADHSDLFCSDGCFEWDECWLHRQFIVWLGRDLIILASFLSVLADVIADFSTTYTKVTAT
jgi:hypothetical protein